MISSASSLQIVTVPAEDTILRAWCQKEGTGLRQRVPSAFLNRQKEIYCGRIPQRLQRGPGHGKRRHDSSGADLTTTAARRTMEPIHVYRKGVLAPGTTELPREFPVNLTVNGREIATLVASPHDLRFLVAGFLRLQGFVEDITDFLMLSVCQDSGIARVQVRKELPERLKPVLTSGCGAGITFSIPRAPLERGSSLPGMACVIAPDAVFRAMTELSARSEGYKRHGGIHSAALASGEGALLLYAEDIGRHNTIDRLAGEALFKGVDLAGRMLVTSGRVSSEMAAKAASLGVSVIASRTSPTDMALRICREAGICLVGYVRGGSFTVYSLPEKMCVPAG